MGIAMGISDLHPTPGPFLNLREGIIRTEGFSGNNRFWRCS